jgi:hypothetical protein
VEVVCSISLQYETLVPLVLFQINLNQKTADKTKKMPLSFATLTVVLLLSAVLVVPSLAYAESDNGKTNSRDNDRSHEKDRKDKDNGKDNNNDDNKGTDCNSKKYDKECDDIAADKRDVAHDLKAIDKATKDLAKDKLHHENTKSDEKALAKAIADLAKDSSDLANDLKSV